MKIIVILIIPVIERGNAGIIQVLKAINQIGILV